MTQQHNALRLADWCEANSSGAYRASSQAASELRRQYFALSEWFEKTQWVQKAVQPRELGMHRADILRTRIESLQAELTAEAARTAEEKLRADQMAQQHRMQCNMRMESDRLIIEAREKEDRLRVALEVIALGSSANPVIDAGDELVALGYWREDALKEDRLQNPVKADPRDARIADLEAQLSAIGAGGVESLSKRGQETWLAQHFNAGREFEAERLAALQAAPPAPAAVAVPDAKGREK